MSGRLILFSVGLSIGLHVIAISGASVLLPNSESNQYRPIEVVLVEFSEPTHRFSDLIVPVAAVKSVSPEMSAQEPETANDIAILPKEEHDAVDISSPVEEPAAKPARVKFYSDATENNIVQGDQGVALPLEVKSSYVAAVSEIMRQDVQYLSRVSPRYPRLARKRGWEGTVLLEVEVLSSGNVGVVRVAHSSGHKVLDRAAQKAVEKWRFSVNSADGMGFTATVEVPMTFELDSSGEKHRG